MLANIPATQTVIEIKAPGGPEVLVPATRPVPEPKTGEVLIRIAAGGVNRADCLQRMGRYPMPQGAPDIPGLECSGTVVKLGWRRTLPYVALLAVASAVVVVAWAPLRARVASTLAEVLSADPGTAAGWRVAATPIGIQMFLDHFLTGVGIGQQRTLWRHYAPTYIFTPGAETQLPIHNAYLAIAIDLGVFGLTLLLLLMALAWRRLRRLQAYFRGTAQPDMLDATAAAEVALVSYIASIAMYPGVENFRYFWVLLALVGALTRVYSDQRASARPTVAVRAVKGA